jgi:hypothetical protein
LTEDGGEVVVWDPCCTNRTSINGWRVERGRLKPGDELSIADMRFRVEKAPAATREWRTCLMSDSVSTPPPNKKWNAHSRASEYAAFVGTSGELGTAFVEELPRGKRDAI